MSITLKAFLESIQLEQYYEAFLNSGATDQDLPQFIGFNEQELAEVLSVLNMLPFHAIKFKKSLRELKVDNEQPRSNNIVSSSSANELIISNAIIYGKKNNRALTSYEEAINNAALELALENPTLISKKGELFDLAKKKLLDSGYRYKRGSSRSKLKEKETKSIKLTTTEEQQKDILKKRHENAQHLSNKRLEKIQLLQEQVEEALSNRINTESKLVTGSHEALDRLGLEAELIHYEETKIKLTKEISKLKSQERKHQWYKRRKVERTLSQSTDEGFSSQNSNCYPEEEERRSAFSIYNPISSQQEYNHNNDDYSSSSSSILSCTRESDVRASLISDYDR